MSQKANNTHKKGAKVSSHKGLSERGSSAAQEESKVPQKAPEAKPKGSKKLKKNSDENVSPQ